MTFFKSHPPKLKHLFLVIMTLSFLISGFFVIFLVNHHMREQAISEARNKALALLDQNLAIHTYFSHDLKPKLFSWTEPFRSEEYFDPIWMSSTYVVRKSHDYFEELNQEGLYYKEAAVNARSPGNEADAHEREFLKRLNRNPDLIDDAAIRSIDGMPWYVVLRRGESMESSCLRCHGDPEDAPKDLVKQYGDKRSFGRTLDDPTVQAISIRIPLADAYADANRFSLKLSGFLLLILGLLYLIHFLMLRYLFFAPLASIQDTAAAIADNKKEPGAQIPEPVLLEWQMLTSTFNRMSATVGDIINHLNQRVAEKTAELQGANQQLQQKILEKEKAEEKFRRFFEANPNYCYIVSNQGSILEANAAALNVLGYEREELMGQPVEMIYAPESQKRRMEIVEEWKGNGHIKGEELILMSRSGERRTVLLSASHTRDAEGGIFNSISIQTDITERKRMEAALRESQAILRAALDQSQAGIVIADAPEGNIRYVNRAGLMTHGVEIAEDEAFDRFHKIDIEFYNRSWKALYPNGKSCTKDDLPLVRAYKYKETCSREMIIQRVDGKERIVVANAGPIFDEKGEVTAGIVVFLDITEQRKAEEEIAKIEAQLRQAQKMETVGQLAGGVAHDFNNLLYVISGYAEIAEMQAKEDDRLADNIRNIITAAEQAATLVRQLLLFSRKESMQTRVLDINELIGGLLKMLRRVIGEHIHPEYHPGYDLKQILGDPAQLEQVLINLCVNARDAMPEGGKIVIETENFTVDEGFCHHHPWSSPGEYVCLVVSDTGTGMTLEIQEKVFEPFFTTKEVGKGTGLGLSAAYGIVKAHNGMIHIYSEPEHGSVFRIYLPALDGAEDEEDVPKPKVADSADFSGEETILVAEDEEKVRKLSELILSKAGYRILTASDGEAAMEIIQESGDEIDLVLVDVIMPKAGGHLVHAKIESLYPDMPVIFMTGYSRGLLPKIFSDHPHEILQKPFNRAQLLQKVREALGQKNGR